MLKIIKLIAVFFICLLFIIGLSLFLGIKVDSFSFGNFSVSKLYLKYDKKLILEIGKLNFSFGKNRKKVANDTKAIYNTLSNLPLILNTFERIDIERLNIGDNHFTFTLNKNYMYLDNNEINLASSLSFAASQITMDISSLYIKNSGLTLFGKSKVDTRKNIINFFGSYNYKAVDGDINIQLKDDILDFYINTINSIKSISFLKDFIRLDKVAEQWMYDNVTGDITLNYLYGKFDINKMKLLEHDLKGNATIDNAKIRFNKAAKVVDTSKLTINFKKDTLYFDLDKPSYNGNSIDGSRVYIEHLTSLSKGRVIVDLKTNSILNDDILEILKAFKINLPLKQLDGKASSSLVLKIPYLAKNKMDIDGKFHIKNANMKLNNFDFFIKDANVVLKDTLVKIVDSDVSHKDMLNAKVKLDIDTKKHLAKGSAFIKEFKIDSKNKSVIKLKDFDTKLKVDFNENTTIDLVDLNTLINIQKENINVLIRKLGTLYNYSDILKDADITSGELSLDIVDENNIEFNFQTNSIDYPIYKNGKKIDSLKLKGIVKDNKTELYNEEKDIQIELLDNSLPLVKLVNFDVDISNNKDEKNKTLPNLKLEVSNSNIIIDDKHTYKANWANFKIENNEIKFSADVIGLDLPISKDGKKITHLQVDGIYNGDIIKIESSDKNLELDYNIKNEKVKMSLNGYDVIYNTSDETDEKNTTAYYIDGINSNIIINKKHIAKAKKYNFIFENHQTKIDLTNDEISFKYYKGFDGKIKVNALNMNDKFLNALFGKNLIEGGIVNINAEGSNGIITGKADITNSKIVDLAILNNLLILVNTSPGLINPLLAIPSVVGMATNGGFNLNGYRVVEGQIDFTYNLDDKFLNMKRVFTKGNGIDFDGYTTIDFKTSKVDSELKMVFFKNYSKIVGSIPVVNYILLGDENRVSTKVQIYGTLEEPQYKTVFIKEGIKAPYNFIKRIITSPMKLFESDEKKEEKK
ncbi:MAG: AsmA-like C-terminal domain-containing protein [Halarcobacter sp.]